ncbi:MAG: hypothetical protein JWM41_2285 [Gemmatimonadetes bacterium]|nr:hypothetical protein [Gemmatimonadota bacterium]
MSAINIIVDGRTLAVEENATVAVALLDAREYAFRTSVSGEARGPLCGMGVCYECRVTIDGVPHRRACLVVVAAGMRIETAAARA